MAASGSPARSAGSCTSGAPAASAPSHGKNRGQRFVFDAHQGDRQFGRLNRFCRHGRYGLAVVFGLADCEDRSVPVDRAETRDRLRQITSRDDVYDAGHSARLAGVDRDDASAGRIKGDKFDVKHVRKRNVREELLGSTYAFAAAKTAHIGADVGFEVLSAAPRCMARPVRTTSRIVTGRDFRETVLAESACVRHGADGFDYSIVSAAAAKVARQGFANLLIVCLEVLVQ